MLSLTPNVSQRCNTAVAAALLWAASSAPLLAWPFQDMALQLDSLCHFPPPLGLWPQQAVGGH